MNQPLAWFLTWHSYGTWLPGNEKGYVDEEHRLPGEPFAMPNPELLAYSESLLQNPAVYLNEPQRVATQAAVIEVCQYRMWELFALHVRTTHVHAVVTGQGNPEKMIADFKAYATRRLRRENLNRSTDKIWAGHGSTRYLWTQQHVEEAVDYVLNRQGTLMVPAPFVSASLS